MVQDNRIIEKDLFEVTNGFPYVDRVLQKSRVFNDKLYRGCSRKDYNLLRVL